MEIGKISENVLKRSIFRQLKSRREEIRLGAGLGEDCAILSSGPETDILLGTAVATGMGRDLVFHGIHRAVNNIAACGGGPIAVLLTILLPPSCGEEELRALMEQAEGICARLHIQIAGGHTEVAAVDRIVLTVTAVGKTHAGSGVETGTLQPGAELVVTKWIGLEGTAIAAREREKNLLERFPAWLVEEAKGSDRYLSVLPEAAVAGKSGICAMTDVSEGGIFGALWEMAESSGVGLDIELKKIPIRQETVEICNHLDLNPYQLLSGGSLLIGTKGGNDLVRRLEAEGIPAAVVGRATGGNDRVVHNGTERRFLGPVGADELYKLDGQGARIML